MVLVYSAQAVIEKELLINIVFHGLEFLIIGFLAIQFSIQRKKTEDALGQLQLFIRMVSHDVTQPVTVAMLYAQLLGKTSDKKAKQSIKQIINALNQLQQRILDLKNLTQLRNGMFIVSPAIMDLYPTLKTIIEEQQINTKKHKIVLKSPKKLIGKWDKNRLDQVITNLISNAIKYSENGEITITAEQTKWTVVLSVKDSGIGIPYSQQNQLFKPYHRLEQKKEVGGTGLGLYICKLIIEGHHGKIWVKSEKGKGSTFFIKLPR